MLGIFEVGGKTKIVCACKDFTAGGHRLFVKSPKDMLEHFWDVFVVDALFGNFERHNGNWGFLFDDITVTAEVSSFYDCGSCLLPQADETVMQQVLTQEEALNARYEKILKPA